MTQTLKEFYTHLDEYVKDRDIFRCDGVEWMVIQHPHESHRFILMRVKSARTLDTWTTNPTIDDVKNEWFKFSTEVKLVNRTLRQPTLDSGTIIKNVHSGNVYALIYKDDGWHVFDIKNGKYVCGIASLNESLTYDNANLLLADLDDYVIVPTDI